MRLLKRARRCGLSGISIQQKITFVFSVLFVLLFLLQMFLFSQFLLGSVSARANDYILETLRQTNGKIDAVIDTANRISKSIVANAEIRDTVIGNLRDPGLASVPYADNEKIAAELSKISLAYDGINSIQIYSGRFAFSYNFASGAEDYEQALNPAERTRLDASTGGLVLLSMRREYVDKTGRETTFVFSAVRKFLDFRTGEELGYVFVNLNESMLGGIIRSARIGASGRVSVFDSDGLIVSGEDAGEIGEPVGAQLAGRLAGGERAGFFIADGDSLVVYCVSALTGWGTVTRLRLGEVTSEYGDLRRYNIVLSLFGIAFATFVSLHLSKWLTKPLKELVSTMKRIQEGDLDAKVKIVTGDEIGDLGRVFNEMTSEMQTLLKQYYSDELSKKELELKALQTQLSPHFLYNSLDSVYWMLVVKGEREIAETVISLCEILRYTIERKAGMVGLDRELQMIGYYMTIQKARFGSKLEFSVSAEPSLRALAVPRMILQPLAENAIAHGMDSKKPLLSIRVGVRAEGGRLAIEVADNGMGISRERLDHILDLNAEEAQPGHTGLGLGTVHRRIQILLGAEYGLSVESALGEGTTVRLALPLIRQEGTA
jgi:two-component system sensor histidine kinase YesM